nr:glycosyl hydrolase 115 family protein [Eubacterium sp.]
MKFELNKAGIYVDKKASDVKGLSHVAKILAEDVKLVADKALSLDETVTNGPQILVGTLGHSPMLDELVAAGAVDVSDLQGKRESYMIRLTEVNGSEKLVVAGTETIATLFGMYHISKEIGVSPWVYWADVKPAKQSEIIFDESIHFVSKEPSIKFRGFFMNDEWPALGNFVMKTFGDFNEFFYEKVFDLLLRLKGNYFWPAMWSASLPLDGSEDPLAIVKLATDLGITIGQSHHEPLMRASEEWDKVKSDENNVGYGKDWNYYTNKEGLYRYWEDGAERDKDFKHMITIGMRGERDTMMLGENSTIQENVELLREIITDQKKIIKEKGCDHMPKMLALYKEVEGFYYGGNGVKGLRDWDGLDDTILLLSDDNFANVRTLPTEDLRDREAGWGLYYHFDYHGAPISYEWVNSTPLPKVWEQVSMAYDYGIRDLWIVNVGDIRPDELPLSYFMELAYDFESMGTANPNQTDVFLAKWVEEQFGAYIKEENTKVVIADVLREYARIHGMRRPEAMNPKVYHVAHFNETKKMIARCEALIEKAESIKDAIPEESKDSFYSLVYYPAVAGMNLQLMSLYAALNNWYAEQGIVAANVYADKVKEAIQRDEDMTEFYHKEMANGKWDGMMLSKHACFVTWNEEGWHFPETVSVEAAAEGKLLVHAENAETFVTEGTISLPEFTSVGAEHYSIELANTGATAVSYEVKAPEWVQVSATSGAVDCDVVVLDVCVNAKESMVGDIAIQGPGTDVTVKVVYTALTDAVPVGTFIERDGIVSMEAEHFVKNEAYGDHQYEKLEAYGKTLSSMKIYPTIGNFDEIGKAPCLTYSVYVKEAGDYTLQMITAPSNNLEDGRTMRYAVVANDGEMQVGDTILAENFGIGGGPWTPGSWSLGVLNNCHTGVTKHALNAGVNEIRVYGVEAGLVLQKLVLYRENLPESYLGPDESPRA